MTTLEQLAVRLREAYGTKGTAPLRDGLAPDDIEGAYAVQALNTEYWKQAGRQIVGRKIGLTSTAVQKQLGVNQPDFGVLFSDMRIPDGGVLRSCDVIQAKAEAEVAIVLARDLDQDHCTIADILRVADYAVAAIEIVDSRISNWQITFADTVADNGSSAFFVLGEDRRSLKNLDLYSCGMVLEVNGKVASIGAGAACLGHPMAAAVWLANTLLERGETLRAGDIILTGALGPMIAMQTGDTVRTQIGGLGACSFSFEEENQ